MTRTCHREHKHRLYIPFDDTTGRCLSSGSGQIYLDAWSRKPLKTKAWFQWTTIQAAQGGRKSLFPVTYASVLNGTTTILPVNLVCCMLCFWRPA